MYNTVQYNTIQYNTAFRGSMATWITRGKVLLGHGDREVALGLGGTTSDLQAFNSNAARNGGERRGQAFFF